MLIFLSFFRSCFEKSCSSYYKKEQSNQRTEKQLPSYFQPKDKIEEKQTGNPKLKDKPRLEARKWQKRRKKETTVILPGLGNAGGRMVGWLVGW